ncbi:hypothetical protein REPUB_Repub12eG0200800 [Reevesia pubescens]
MKGAVISVLVVLAMVHFMVKPGEAAINCADVTSSLKDCLPYLVSGAGNPTAACCSGLDRLQKMARTTPDKQAACTCAKDAAAHLPTLKEDAAASLPAKCNIQFSYPISKNTNCQE